MPESPLLTVSEMAERLRISTRTLQTLVSQHKIPHFRAGRQIRFDEADVIEALREGALCEQCGGEIDETE